MRNLFVIPAKAGISQQSADSRLRGNDVSHFLLLFYFLFLTACGHGPALQENHALDTGTGIEEETLLLDEEIDAPVSDQDNRIVALSDSNTATDASRFFKEVLGVTGRKPVSPDYISPLSTQQTQTLSSKTGFNTKTVRGFYQTGLFNGFSIKGLIDNAKNWKKLFPSQFSNRWLIRCNFCKYLLPNNWWRKLFFLTGDTTPPLEVARRAENVDVAFDSDRDHFLVVWDEADADGSNVYATLLDADGTTPLREKVLISTPRTTHKCLLPNFTQVSKQGQNVPGLSEPVRCTKNLDPQAAYSDGKFLIVWTLEETAAVPENFEFSVILGKMIASDTLEPVSPDWSEGLLLSKVQYGSTTADHAPTQDSEVLSWSVHKNPTVAANTVDDNFLAIWETNKDYVGCITPDRWSSTSIYGRVIRDNFFPGRSGVPGLVPVFTDPSTATDRCIPNSDVSIGLNPRVGFHADLEKFLVVFESSKNVTSRKPSIGAELVAIANNLTTTVTDPNVPTLLLSKVNQGLFNPDVATLGSQFIMACDADGADLSLSSVAIDNLTSITESTREMDLGTGVQSNPKLALTMTGTPPEMILAFEQRAQLGATEATIDLVALDESLTPTLARLSLQDEPTNLRQEIAANADIVLTAWFTTDGEDRSAITSSAAALNQITPPQNQRPTAMIGFVQGSATVLSGTPVILTGASSSDPEDGSQLIYEWSQIAGSAVTLETPSQVQTRFIAPTVAVSQSVVIQLKVYDRLNLASLPATKTITINPLPPQNQRPTGVIDFIRGSTTVTSGTLVTLTATSSSDPEDGTELRYEWSQIGGPTVTLGMPSQIETDFVAPTVAVSQTVIIQLKVYDTQDLASLAVTKNITVNPPAPTNNRPPARVTVEEGLNPNNIPESEANAPYLPTVVTLNGSTSDAEDPDQTLTYEWLQIDGGPDNTIRNPEVLDNGTRFRFTAPDVIFPATEQIVQMQLTVDDGQTTDSRSSPMLLILHFTYVNQPPAITVLSDFDVDEGDPVFVAPQVTDNDATQNVAVVWSRLDNDPLVIDWTQEGDDLSFTAPMVATDTVVAFLVTATDQLSAESEKEVAILIYNVNQVPTAPLLQKPADTVTLPPTKVYLQWGASTDPDVAEGDAITYTVLLDTVNPPVAVMEGCEGISATDCVLTTLIPDTDYYWQVVAEDTRDASTPSSIGSFHTDTSVVGRWLFNEGMGNTVIDRGANGYHGTFLAPRNSPTWVGNGDTFLGGLVADVVDGAVGFSGNDYLHFNSLSLSNVSQQAIELWFRTDRLQSGEEYELFASRNTSDGMPQMYVPIYGGSGWVSCLYIPSSDVGISSRTSLPLHGLVHLICQFGPGGMQMYLNGTRVDNRTDVISFGNRPGFSEMGWNSLEDLGYFYGVVDEMTIYNHPLTTDDIANSRSAHR